MFPEGSYPYLVGWLYIAKYVVATLTAYVYLRDFLKERQFQTENYAIIAALLYAFSGFQATNLEFFHFHDVVAFFPLLLWGIEHIDSRKHRVLFAVAIWLNCLINYFFFVQEVVFMIIYFLFRYWGSDIRTFLRRVVRCCLCGVLGIGMAAVLFLPNILYIRGNNRSELSLYLSNFLYSSQWFLQMLKGILLPGEAMMDHSAVINQHWQSTDCYLPLFGLSLVFAYLLRQHNWLKKLLCLLLFISLFPMAQAAFLLFAEDTQRWWYMLTLMMALASMKVMESPAEYPIGKGVVLTLGITSAFYALIQWMPWDAGDTEIVYHPARFAFLYGVAMAGPILLLLLQRMKRWSYRSLLPLTMCFCAMTTIAALHYYHADENWESYLKCYRLSSELNTLDDQYRYNTATDFVQMLVGDVGGVGGFSSTMENATHEFDDLFGINTANMTTSRMTIPGLPQLLGGKYNITGDATADHIVDEISTEGLTWYITEQDACPIGFAMDSYMTVEELKALPQEQRAYALMQAAVIDETDETAVHPVMLHIETQDMQLEQESEGSLIAQANENAVKDFTRSAHDFTCTTDYERDRMVYFTVPNDTGWTATIDGVEAGILNSGGMMLLCVPAGEHQIIFTYQTPGLAAGEIISLCAWGIFDLLVVVQAKKVYRDESEFKR